MCIHVVGFCCIVIGIATLWFWESFRRKRQHNYMLRRVVAECNLKICVVGAGFSGIAIGRKLERLGIDYKIIEKNCEVGGTWYDNIYPGVGCDVMSHLYSLSDKLNPNWSQSFSEGSEILDYVKNIASPIRAKIQFNTSVLSASWNNKTLQWRIVLSSGEELYFDIIITGTGLLHKPHFPNFPCSNQFQGVKVHTNRWDVNLDMTDKNVGIIGTGASAIQAIPKIANMDILSLTVFQRTPAWCPTRVEYKYYPSCKKMFHLLPLINRLYRWYLFLRYEVAFFIMFMLPSKEIPIIGRTHALIQSWVHENLRQHIRNTVTDQNTAEKLTPKIPMGCKRITPSTSYLQTFNKQNVKLVTEDIFSFYDRGIITRDKVHHNLDVIIYATGFDLIGSVNSFEVKGLGGASLSDYHSDHPKSYLGVANPLCPNFFTIGGPGSVLGHNSALFIGECQINYIMLAIKEMIWKKARMIVLEEKALEKFMDWTSNNMKNKVFEGGRYCTSWYQNARGVNWSFWPSNLIAFWLKTKSFDSHNYSFL